MPKKDTDKTPEKITKDTELVRTKSPDTTPSDADLASKNVGSSYINEYNDFLKNCRFYPLDPIEAARLGGFLGWKKEEVEQHNTRVSRGEPGQVVEVSGNKESHTVMARFENQDGSLAYEKITSAPTPPDVDREEYYDNFVHMFGRRDETYLPSISHPSKLEQDTSTEAVSAQGKDVSSSALDERKLEDSDKQTKRSKKDGDDDSKGSGSATSGSSDIGTSGPIDSAGPSNFRSYLDQTLVILISITSSILDAVNEIFILM